MSAAESFCRDLIRIPSEDPPGDNRPICDFIERFLRKAGAKTKRAGCDPLRPNLVARFEFGAGPNLIFNGHMETLPVGDRTRWSCDPFEGKIENGRLYGRGAACMKGGIAAMTHAALALLDQSRDLRGSLTLTFVSDEVNGGGKGTGWLLEHAPETRGDAALVGEGGSSYLCCGQKGVMLLLFRAKGDGGHGAYGFLYSSATHRMLAALQDVQKLAGPRTPRSSPLWAEIEKARDHFESFIGKGVVEALFSLSVNIGVIQGGRKVNMIAEDCTAEIDLRLPPGTSVASVRTELDALLARHEGVSYELLWGNDPGFSDPNAPWLTLLRECKEEVLGKKIPVGFMNAFTDARFFHARRIPAAAVGVKGGGVGGADEFIELDSLSQTAKLFTNAAARFLHKQS